MEKIKKFFNNFNEKRSYQIVFFIISMCIVVSSYLKIRFDISCEVVEDTNLVRCIERAEVVGNELIISGWSFYEGTDSSKDKIQVFLKEVNNEKNIIWLKVNEIVRDDVQAYFDCEYNYSMAGFEAKTKINNLDVFEKDYEIFLRVTYPNEGVTRGVAGKNQTKTVSANRYLLNGDLSVHRNKELMFQKTKAEEVNLVINEGELLAHSKEHNISVFRYKEMMYWIADEGYRFNEDGKTVICYQLYTTKPDRLPEYSIVNQLSFENRTFLFEQAEIVVDSAPYRVAVRDIPVGYPIVRIFTGNENHNLEGNVWQSYIYADFVSSKK